MLSKFSVKKPYTVVVAVVLVLILVLLVLFLLLQLGKTQILTSLVIFRIPA